MNNTPKPQPRSKMSPPPSASAPPPVDDLSNLPNVPLDLPDVPSSEGNNNEDDIDFDDLSRRFEELKKKK